MIRLYQHWGARPAPPNARHDEAVDEGSGSGVRREEVFAKMEALRPPYNPAPPLNHRLGLSEQPYGIQEDDRTAAPSDFSSHSSSRQEESAHTTSTDTAEARLINTIRELNLRRRH
jgi:hypothetical protein